MKTNGNGITSGDLEIDTEFAQVLPPATPLSEEEKKNPAHINLAVFDRLERIDQNLRVNLNIGRLQTQKYVQLENKVTNVCDRVTKIEAAHKTEEEIDAAVKEVKDKNIVIDKTKLKLIEKILSNPWVWAVAITLLGGGGIAAVINIFHIRFINGG